MQGKRVEIHNPGGVAVEMTSWVLSDEAANHHVFPSFTLPGGTTATVWTKAGTDKWDRSVLGTNSGAVWNSDGDTATLTTDNGTLEIQSLRTTR
ncbi:MAG: lamin tail domain-containing protein [Caldilinea sp.]